MLSAITAALSALAAYLNLLNKTAPFRYHEQADALEDEINALRKSTAVADQLRADLLAPRVMRLRRQADELANLPAAHPAPKGGGVDSDC